MRNVSKLVVPNSGNQIEYNQMQYVIGGCANWGNVVNRVGSTLQSHGASLSGVSSFADLRPNADINFVTLSTNAPGGLAQQLAGTPLGSLNHNGNLLRGIHTLVIVPYSAHASGTVRAGAGSTPGRWYMTCAWASTLLGLR
ncbi:MAG: hypothetical protein FWB72_00120 [Firmicutes bacterium]|nr:hypothetical protein [Bacillota bacterium]